jgi:probable phosphoglycerate mutase
VTTRVALFDRPFYFVRHGETETNARKVVAGSLDTELTQRGREQARETAEALAGEPITGIYSSPLKRARDTSAPIAERLQLPVTILPELAERNWGVLEGQPRGTRMRGTTPEGAEPPDAFYQRILSGLAQIDSEVPLVVAHSGVFRVLCRALAVGEPKSAVANCLPVRFDPVGPGAWKMELACTNR